MTNEATIVSTAPASRLYSIGQITFATWAATPLAGCLLLNFNYRVLQRRRAAWQSLLWGFVSSVAVFAIAFFRPNNVPKMTLPVACAAIMWPLASYLQGDALKNHLASGGKKGSWWVTVGLSLGIVILIFAVAVVGIMLYRYFNCYYQCGPTNRWTRAAGACFST